MRNIFLANYHSRDFDFRNDWHFQWTLDFNLGLNWSPPHFGLNIPRFRRRMLVPRPFNKFGVLGPFVNEGEDCEDYEEEES